MPIHRRKCTFPEPPPIVDTATLGKDNRPVPRGNQLARQWRLLQLIDRPAGVTVQDASRELACTIRTIWRDLSVLQDAGFPIFDDKAPDGRRGLWRINEEFKARLPLKLSLAELAALLMSRDLLQPNGVGILGPAVRTDRKSTRLNSSHIQKSRMPSSA